MKRRPLDSWQAMFVITLALGALLGAYTARAQDRTITVREVDVAPRKAEVDVLADGGCMLTAYATISAPSVEPVISRSEYAFNGARCTTVKSAIVQAAKNDLGVGTGAAP